MSIPVAPLILVRWMAPFQSLFCRPTWRNALVLILGAVLAPGRRTATAALSVLGLRQVLSKQAMRQVAGHVQRKRR